MKKQKITARQGDVWLRQIDRLPAGAKEVKIKNGKIVLAWGELTGHHHRIDVAEGEAREFSLASAHAAVRRFLKVVSEATVRHEEHAPIPLPSGVYEIVIQREYAPDAIRTVAD